LDAKNPDRLSSRSERARWRERVGAWDLAVVLVTFLLLSAVVGSIALRYASGPRAEVAVSLLSFGPILLAGAALAVALPFTRASLASLGLVPPTRRWFLLGGLVGLVSVVADFAVIESYQGVFGELPADPDPEYTRQVEQFAARQPILSLLSVCLAAPVAEEVVFRGMLYAYLRRWGIFMALAVSSLLFGLSHGLDLVFLPMAVIFGVAMALLYEGSQSLWPPILAHMLHNVLVLAAASYGLGFGS